MTKPATPTGTLLDASKNSGNSLSSMAVAEGENSSIQKFSIRKLSKVSRGQMRKRPPLMPSERKLEKVTLRT